MGGWRRGEGGVSLGFTWPRLVSLGFTWIHLNSLGFTRIHVDSLQTHLDLLRLTAFHLDSLGLIRTHLDSLGLTWTHKQKEKRLPKEILPNLTRQCHRAYPYTVRRKRNDSPLGDL